MKSKPSQKRRSRARSVALAAGLFAIVSMVSGCIVVPVGPPHYHYYRYGY